MPGSQRYLDLPRAKGDFPGVNIKPLLKIFSISLVGVALAARASAHDDVSPAISLGNDTFAITAQAGNALMRDTDKLKDEANDAAAKYCEAQGKVLKVISLTSKSPRFSLGYCEAKITFMALNAGDPALLPPAPVAASAPYMAPPPPAPRNLTTDELVAELTKLDDLRKKGILTDDEFQSEKRKVLSHSN
jgi:hypothetical protein